MYARFSELKASLQHAFGDTLPAVVTLRFANPTSVFLYTENSTPQYVLEQLGLSSALPQPPKEWGIVQKRLSELQHVEQGYVLYFLPFAEEKKCKIGVVARDAVCAGGACQFRASCVELRRGDVAAL